MRARGLVLMIGLAAAGCLPRRAPLPPPPTDVGLRAPAPPTGSIWHPEVAGNYAFVDVRARFPGDLLTVVVSEDSTGKKAATTAATADSSISASVEDFFGLPAAAAKLLPTGFNPASIVKSTTSHASKGDGSTDRSGSLSANVTVTVIGVGPSGNLRVQGSKVVRVNREDEYVVVSGNVRPEDIASDNSVPSTRLADARIDYYGSGTLGDKQGVPLAHRLFDWVWPF